jgi:probable phosphoglycerate mutase
VAIYLIRHGETDANATRIVQRPGVPLSARGLEQVSRLAERLAGAGIGRIVSSDLRRATMTALPLAQATGAQLVLDAGLRERDYGDIRGRAYADLDGDIFAPDYAPPGGETWAAFHARVDATWTRLRVLAGDRAGHLALVTHGLVCGALASRHLDVATASLDGHRWPNACVTIIEGDDHRRVVRLGCTAHLDGHGDLPPRS